MLARELKGEEAEVITEEEAEEAISAFRKVRGKRDKVHDAELKVYSEIAESLFEVRLMKVVEGKRLDSSFDSWIQEVVTKMREFYVNLLTGGYVTKGNKVLCHVKTEVAHGGISLKPGDYLLTPAKTALYLWLQDLVEPARSS
ncbi:hypothetical protein GWK48_02610 [Metallosphaera tengchongensis]|uniref:DNA replication complex GINS family protein n=1 Tax=Metallosphaera tengchongensis TaxID=1532350 RepID=A0A6N0NW98_9CREN|nr:hypothetical protein [Metallosphaera tengchongensis]QKQ99429.1 hypothetical protein GWK48_02610 [Metallosphaera tengchongensis]